MRLLIEAAKGQETDHTDGIKVFEPRGWVQMIPDPDEPVFHLFAEGASRQDSSRLEVKYRLCSRRSSRPSPPQPSTRT